MATLPETWRRESVNGELKKVVIKSTSAAATGDTVDMGTDAANAKGTILTEITDAYHVGATGTRVDAGWVASTGIVTLGTIAGSPAQVYVVIEGY